MSSLLRVSTLSQSLRRSLLHRWFSTATTSADQHKKVFPSPLQSSPAKQPSKFNSLSLHPSVVAALNATGKDSPLPIQAAAIPPILSHRHTLIAAETGSGKTIAYLAPLISAIKAREGGVSLGEQHFNDDGFELASMPLRPSVLVLQPTRELTDQVLRIAKALSHTAKFRVRAVSGGSKRRQFDKRLLNSTTDLLIATPGALTRLQNSAKLFLSRVHTVVLDEADELLEAQNPMVEEKDDKDGSNLVQPERHFGAQLRPVLSALNRDKVQFVYVAATVPARLEQWVRERHPGLNIVRGNRLHRATSNAKVKTTFIRVDGTTGLENMKFQKMVELVTSTLAREDTGKILIFCDGVDRRDAVVERLDQHRIEAVHLGGDSANPWKRDENWARFRDNDSQVAVCARSFARGIDDVNIATVVMMDVPFTGGEYLHRVGRIRKRGRVYVLVGRKEEKIAETLFIAHVKEEQIANIDPKTAWEAHLAANHDRIESDIKIRRARKNQNARWVDERSSEVGTFRGRFGRKVKNVRTVKH